MRQRPLSITGIPAARQLFEPLVPGAHKVPNTNSTARPSTQTTRSAFGRWAADQYRGGDRDGGAGTLSPRCSGSRRASARWSGLHRRPVTSRGCGRSATGTTDGCLRRGHLRIRPARAHVRREALRLRAGHHHRCEGHHLRARPARRERLGDPVYEPFATGLINLDTHLRLHLRRPPGFCGFPSPGESRPVREGRVARPRSGQRALRLTLERLRDLPIVGDVRGAGYFDRDPDGQGQGDQGDLRRRRVRAAAARGSCRRRSSTPGSTAVPTTVGIRLCSWPRRWSGDV